MLQQNKASRVITIVKSKDVTKSQKAIMNFVKKIMELQKRIIRLVKIISSIIISRLITMSVNR